MIEEQKELLCPRGKRCAARPATDEVLFFFPYRMMPQVGEFRFHEVSSKRKQKKRRSAPLCSSVTCATYVRYIYDPPHIYVVRTWQIHRVMSTTRYTKRKGERQKERERKRFETDAVMVSWLRPFARLGLGRFLFLVDGAAVSGNKGREEKRVTSRVILGRAGQEARRQDASDVWLSVSTT